MKTLPKAMGILVLALFGTLASGAAMADRHGGVRFGLYMGVPFGPAYYPPYAPYYAPPYYYPPYYPPVTVVQSSPPTYVEQSAPQAAPAQAQGDWYYCAASRTYYPYAKECPSGWQRVPAQPR